MRFSILASGSKANATLIQTQSETLLLDCGLKYRELSRRLEKLNVSPSEITAVILTHEHEDHLSGVPVLSKKLDVPIFISEKAFFSASKLADISPHRVFFYNPGMPFEIGDCRINAHEVSHDASLTVGLVIESLSGKKFSYFTDLGCFDTMILDFCANSDALIIEANHDEEKLWTSAYPWQVKERIASTRGHLSNNQANEFVVNLQRRSLNKQLQVIVGAHLSDNSNKPELAIEALRSGVEGCPDGLPQIMLGSPSEASPLITLR